MTELDLSQMSTRVCFCILIICASFSPVTHSQNTQNFTVQTPLSTDLSEYLLNFTDNEQASTTQTPLTITKATTDEFREESDSSATVEPSVTFTDGTLVHTTDAVIEHSTNPTAARAKNTTQNFTDQTVVSTDLTKYPSTYTANSPITTNQSNLTMTAEFRTNSTSSDQINSSVSSETVKPNATFTDGTTVQPTDITTQSSTNLSACLCDVTIEFCDIGCCCDVMDCGLLNLSSVFNGCQQGTEFAVCLESWLMFKANIDPALVTLTGNLFCVQKEDKHSDVQSSLAVFQSSYIYPFLLREPTAFNSQNTNFYKADDIILTYYNSTSIVSTLKQPSPGPASSACVSRNPARFLRSSSLACSRLVTAHSCVEDRSFNAGTYYTGFSVLRVPEAQVEDRPELLIPISISRDWPEPREQNGICLNVVSKVEYGIEYTGKGEIVKITLKTELININVNTQLLQNHVVTFQLVTSTLPMATPTSYPNGIKPGTPVTGWFGEEARPITLLGSSENGGCSERLADRLPVLFGQNTITGCTFRSLASECGVLQAELMEVLTASAVPELISMTTGAQSDRSTVITKDCSTPASNEVCETGCLLPVSLSMQVLWARRGLKALPQNHILGAKFIFSCQRLKCPLRSSVPVTTEVVFSDSTVYPEIPGGEPQPQWKFPFAFFSRGAGEFDQEFNRFSNSQ